MSSAVQVARYTLGFSWIYHGLVPKILTIAPLERAMTGSLGFSPSISDVITRSAGVMEIGFGVILIVYYRNAKLQIINMVALFGLLLFAALMLPSVLSEAFNPVTTNVGMIALSYIIWSDTRHNNPQQQSL